MTYYADFINIKQIKRAAFLEKEMWSDMSVETQLGTNLSQAQKI